jgi:triosephosphate isomerase (TIM)
MKYVVGNFKSNKNQAAMKAWLDDFSPKINQQLPNGVEVTLAPPLPLLWLTRQWWAGLAKAQQAVISLAVQGISQFPAGSYTGDVSAHTLSDSGATKVILGHSERRRYHGETNQQVANMVTQALDYQIQPLVCLDENYLESQVAVLERASQCWFAYEPAGAIGTGMNKDVGRVQDVVARVTTLVPGAKVLYGGSVTSANVSEYLLVSDGVLVGGATLSPSEFYALILASGKAQT